MKTCKEMTQAVLKEVKRRRKRNGRIATMVAACVILCTAVFASVMAGNAPGQTAQPRLVVMCSAAEYTQGTPIASGVEKPLNFLIRVRDLRGIHYYRDIVKILEEEARFREALLGKEDENGIKPDSQYIRWQDENAMISLIYRGFLYIKVEDYDAVQNVSLETTQAGEATTGIYSYEEGEEIKKGISILWRLSDATVEQICQNPQMKLSAISDTIRVKVLFQDGTTEIAVIELTADEEGQIYVRHKGSITTE